MWHKSIPAMKTVVGNFDDSKRLLARLMARENLTVQVIDGIPTASFDIVRRVLSIPNWTTLTRAQFDMLIGHEVGHALFTDNAYLPAVKKRGLKSYFNVVEDARIERKMKNVYPGLAKDFYEAYQTFTQQGPLFKLTQGDTCIIDSKGETRVIADLSLIDRINLFFKIGAFVPVPFDKTEHKWLRRIQRCPDMATALQIATELYEYAKEDEQRHDKKKLPKQPLFGADAVVSGDEEEQSESDSDEQESDTKKKSRSKDSDDESESDDETDDADDADDEQDDKQTPGGGGDGDGEDGDGADDEDDEQSSGAAGGDRDEDDEIKPIEDPTAATDEDVKDILKKLAEDNPTRDSMRHLLYGTLSESQLAPRIVAAREWSQSVYAEARKSSGLSDAEIEKCLDVLQDVWSRKFMQTAKAMAAEFERRKTAKNYQRAQVAKTGRLDMTKLHQYKFAEDLFLRTTSVPNGQSHGFVMIIDASGSMQKVFPNVVDQALLFAVFCFYAKIPCEIYLFSDVKRLNHDAIANGLLTLVPAGSGQLVGMINTVTDRGAFHQQLRACLAYKAKFRREREVTQEKFYTGLQSLPYTELGGTPLYTGIMLGEAVVARMKRTLRLDKMVFAVVSDGGDTDGVFFEDNSVAPGGRVYSTTRNLNTCHGVVLRDTVTKENHIFVVGETQPRMPKNGPLTMLLDVIKKRHGAQTAYFFLLEGDITTAINLHSREGFSAAIAPVAAATTLREQGQFVFPAGSGVADLTMILPTSGMDLREDVSAGAAAKTVADYVDVLKDRQNSRKFVNAVVPFVA